MSLAEMSASSYSAAFCEAQDLLLVFRLLNNILCKKVFLSLNTAWHSFAFILPFLHIRMKDDQTEMKHDEQYSERSGDSHQIICSHICLLCLLSSPMSRLGPA